jgi:hypothetical protein
MKKLPAKFSRTLYREDLYFVDQIHGSVLHSDQCTAGCMVHMNFTNESACLMADNIRNEVVTIQRSQGVLKMLSLYMGISFSINCFVKKCRYSNTSCIAAYQTATLTVWIRTLWVRC